MCNPWHKISWLCPPSSPSPLFAAYTESESAPHTDQVRTAGFVFRHSGHKWPTTDNGLFVVFVEYESQHSGIYDLMTNLEYDSSDCYGTIWEVDINKQQNSTSD